MKNRNQTNGKWPAWIGVAALFCALIFLSFHWFRPAKMPVMPRDYNRYETEWKTIDSLEQNGLPESALTAVEALYRRALSDQNDPQIIKTLLYRAKYTSDLQEDGVVKAVELLQAEVKTAPFPALPVLQSMLGELYNRYLANNYWTLRSRTATADFKPADLQTWSIEQLLDESKKYYLLSLETPGTRQLRLDDFAAILSEKKNVEGLWPTLYDLLAHRAINHFLDQRSYLNEPANAYILNDPKAFAPVRTFVQTNFEGTDTTSQKLQALHLFQDLLKFRLADDNGPALLDIDLKRLDFVYNQGNVSDKDTLYLQALENLLQQHSGQPREAEVGYAIAQFYFNKGYNYQPGPEAPGQWDWKTAVDWCDKMISAYPESYGAKQCFNLKAQILGPELSLQVEEVAVPKQPFLGLVTYRNTPKIWLRISTVNEKQMREWEGLNEDEAQHRFLQALPAEKTWQLELPNPGDFRSHRTEVPFDGLPGGMYVIMVSDHANFQRGEGQVQYVFAQISRLAYWHRQGPNQKMELVITDRETGKPLPKVKATFSVREYNQQSRRYEYKKIATETSDKNGFITTGLQERGNYYQVELSNKKERLYGTQGFYFYPSRRSAPVKEEMTHFFLDRAIYRPGQTVYFKGLALQKTAENMPLTLPNRDVTVTFLDVNYQKVAELKLKTNAFGTFNGAFTAPASGLTGMMRLQSSIGNSQQGFQVEEYKRPKFEVTFLPVEGTYQLNQQVSITGNAKSYAGAVIDGAQVQYRVVRMPRFPWLDAGYFRWFTPWWSASGQEIASGTVNTGADGNFTINFTALPDLSVPDKYNPEFNYQISADVTDISGETQSGSTDVNVGYVPFRLNLELGAAMHRDSLKKLMITAANLNGTTLQKEISVRIERLSDPGRHLVNRYWEKPDQWMISPVDYQKRFPQYAFNREDDPSQWRSLETVLLQNYTTGAAALTINGSDRWRPGWYAVVLETPGTDGKPMRLRKEVVLYDYDEQVPFGKLVWTFNEKPAYEPGQSAVYHFGAYDKPVYLLVETERKGNISFRKWEEIKGWKDFSYEVAESDRGNVNHYFTSGKFNRFYPETQITVVPWTNKDLHISWGTFRDKLLPGQEEQWQLTISGPKKDKVSAEMVATMYDASLDAFAPHRWSLSLYPNYGYAQYRWSAGAFGAQSSQYLSPAMPVQTIPDVYRQYPGLEWFGFDFGSYGPVMYRSRAMAKSMNPSAPMMMEQASEVAAMDSAGAPVEELKKEAEPNKPPVPPSKEEAAPQTPQIRRNLNETVFFLPAMTTDADGNITIKFTMNEALTRWKFLGFAHTKELQFAFTEKEVVTQKDLMIQPNAPRFLREGDKISFTAKVSNLSKETLSGSAKLELLDALTMQPVNEAFGNAMQSKNFTAPAGQSAPLSWDLIIPLGKVQAIIYRVTAAAGNFTDGEENALPVLTNRMLVTETLPLELRGGQTKTFTLEALRDNTSNTLQHQQLTLEFTSNPAWYAVQALPYLMEYPYDCNEQIFSRYYANSLATTVANAHPRVKEIFRLWREMPVSARNPLESNLAQNQELKTALLEETPWVLDAMDEAAQKRNIGLLFDLNRMAAEQSKALQQLQERQMSNGGFAWFPGGTDNWFITQYIMAGLGHLDKLGVASIREDGNTWNMLSSGVQYLDARAQERYNDIARAVEKGHTKWEDNHLDPMLAHYLYTRSFFLNGRVTQAGKGIGNPVKANDQAIPLQAISQKAFDYFLGQADQYWLSQGLYQQGLISLALNRLDHSGTAAKMVASFKERAIKNETLGMHWKANRGYYWYQHPIETQALMIEVFDEVAADAQAVAEMQLWLLKNKQTNNWKTTKATSEAVYALLMTGGNWLTDQQAAKVKTGGALVQAVATAQQNAEAGTGYWKASIPGNEVTASLATVEIANPNAGPAWGALYWQYFEEMDKIKGFEETPLTLKKEVFLVKMGARGEELHKLDKQALRPGDKLKVRLELRVDRDMEYVHLKDMRASGLEPINVLSGYRWQAGLGYYESTRDLATHFFMDFLPRGTYVFEYPLRVVHNGDFSNGITSIQCMYAPEFSSHSAGGRILVGN